MEQPRTLLEAVRMFKDPATAEDYFARIRWRAVVACPRTDCGSVSVAHLPKYRRWYCNDCKRQFSVKTGTIFEESPIGFDKWLPALWMLSADRNGISSCELARALGVTQKTAWFMLHRIRLAMETGTFTKLFGEVEIDEAYIGGKPRHRGPGPTGTKSQGPRSGGKAIVLGFRQRGGHVRAMVIDNVRRTTLLPKIREHVVPGSIVYTDSLSAYHDAREHYSHFTVNHAYEYVRGNVHTNTIESFWSVLRRTLRGTYVAPRPWHLQRYLDEQIFRFNRRDEKDGPRFIATAKATEGKRITYKSLTAKA